MQKKTKVGGNKGGLYSEEICLSAFVANTFNTLFLVYVVRDTCGEYAGCGYNSRPSISLVIG